VLSSLFCVLCVKAFEFPKAKSFNTEGTEKGRRAPETP
jgi:hypothetical protein